MDRFRASSLCGDSGEAAGLPVLVPRRPRIPYMQMRRSAFRGIDSNQIALLFSLQDRTNLLKSNESTVSQRTSSLVFCLLLHYLNNGTGPCPFKDER
jgi:hypothetical protein